MSRREPVQRRSRKRVELLLTAATELLAEGGVEALTMRSLAARADIPVATIYRYFANRDEIIAAYLDHELQQIDEAVVTAVLGLERVTVRSLAEAVALAHMRHHQAHPEGVPVWFGGRLNPAVEDRVRELDVRLASSLRAATAGAGLLAGTPTFNAELIVRLFDRMFEFVFLATRTADEQEAIVLTFVDIIATYLERFATPAELEGVATQDFALALSSHLAQSESTIEPSERPVVEEHAVAAGGAR
jgi:AcrR family transcriptional regulator